VAENIVKALVGLCILVLCVFLAIWVLGMIGITLPAIVINIVWVIVVLLVILFVLRALGYANWTWR
jgi:hypothetical protein